MEREILSCIDLGQLLKEAFHPQEREAFVLHWGGVGVLACTGGDTQSAGALAPLR